VKDRVFRSFAKARQPARSVRSATIGDRERSESSVPVPLWQQTPFVSVVLEPLFVRPQVDRNRLRRARLCFSNSFTGGEGCAGYCEFSSGALLRAVAHSEAEAATVHPSYLPSILDLRFTPFRYGKRQRTTTAGSALLVRECLPIWTV